jgi:hypothetical protein
MCVNVEKGKFTLEFFIMPYLYDNGMFPSYWTYELRMRYTVVSGGVVFKAFDYDYGYGFGLHSFEGVDYNTLRKHMLIVAGLSSVNVDAMACLRFGLAATELEMGKGTSMGLNSDGRCSFMTKPAWYQSKNDEYSIKFKADEVATFENIRPDIGFANAFKVGEYKDKRIDFLTVADFIAWARKNTTFKSVIQTLERVAGLMVD